VDVFDVSDLYHFDFAGSDGVRHRLENVRLMSSADANFGSFGGIAGMPAMIGRVTTLDMSVWHGGAMEFMGVYFPDALPPDRGRRYTVHLDLVHFEQTGQQNPDDPLPTWAPLPFATARFESGDRSVSGTFLLDTGAQMSIISTQAAFQLGFDRNGDGDLNDDALMFLPIGGVGGQVQAPVFEVERFVLPTEQGVDLVWDHVAVIAFDIEGIPGVFGSDILTSGWAQSVLGDAESADGVFQKVHLDFRNARDSGQGTMVLDLTPDYDVVLEPDAPIASITSPAAPVSVSGTFTCSIEFDQNITDFEAGDLLVENAVLTSFSETIPGRVYTADVDADTRAPLAQVRIIVPPKCAFNAAGHGNAGASLLIAVDPDALVTTVTALAKSPTDVVPIPFRIEFSDSFPDFTREYVEVENGAVEQFVPADGAARFDVSVVPFADGPVTVRVPGYAADGLLVQQSWTAAEATVEYSSGQPANHPPTAQPLNLETNEDVPADGVLLAADDAGDVLTFALVNNPSHGTITALDAASGAFTYTPDANFNGTDAFQFRASDGHQWSAPATVTIEVLPVNDPPVVLHAPQAPAATAGAPYEFVLPGDIFGDPDGDPLTLTASAVDGGPLPAWLTFSSTTRAFSGIPGPGDVGTVTVAVTASDPAGAQITAFFDLAVRETNQPPAFDREPPDQAARGVLYVYRIRTHDPDGPAAGIEVQTTVAPAWLTLVNLGGGAALLTGVPPDDAPDRVEVSLVVLDVDGAAAAQDFQIAIHDFPEVLQITLARGWNLVSCPFAQAAPRRIGDWFTDETGAPLTSPDYWLWAPQTERYIAQTEKDAPAPLQGFWVYRSDLQETVTRSIAGAAGWGVFELQPGWNLVGPPADSAFADILGLLPAGVLPTAWTWDAHSQTYTPVYAADPVLAGRGYWIFFDSDEPAYVDLSGDRRR